MLRMIGAVILAVCLGGVFRLDGFAQSAGGFDGRIREARLLHDRGVDGDKDAVVACIRILEELLDKDPDDQLVRVYLGSAYTLRSRDLWIGPEKLAKLREGGRLMDEAVALASGDMRVRFVRAVNYLKLPALFGKRELAVDELIELGRLAGGAEPSFSDTERQAVYFFAGVAHEKRGGDEEAAAYWRRAVALAPASPLADEIRRALGGLRDVGGG